MTLRDRYGMLAALCGVLAVFAWLLLTSCGDELIRYYDDPGCEAIGTGGVVCVLDKDAPVDIVATLALGLTEWRAVYALEWTPERLDEVLADTAVHYGRLREHDNPCPPMSGGCQDITGWGSVDIWANREWHARSDDTWRSFDGDEWHTAVQHEVIHGAEWLIENRTDYEHDDVKRRWVGLLPDLARAQWQERATR